jgi:hypothetical protein
LNISCWCFCLRIFTFIDEEASGYLSFREFVNACVGGEQGSQLGPLTEMDIAYKYLKRKITKFVFLNFRLKNLRVKSRLRKQKNEKT